MGKESRAFKCPRCGNEMTASSGPNRTVLAAGQGAPAVVLSCARCGAAFAAYPQPPEAGPRVERPSGRRGSDMDF